MVSFEKSLSTMDQRNFIFSLADQLNHFSFDKLSLDEISSQLDDLSKYLVIDNHRYSSDFHFFFFKNDHSPGNNAFFAYFGHKCKLSLSTANYLFCVSGTSYIDLMSRLFFVFNQLKSSHFFSGKYWNSSFRYIDFPELVVFKKRFK